MILGLAVGIVGLMMGWIPNPLEPKGSGVDFYWVYADGTTEPINFRQTMTIYRQELKLYKDSGHAQEIVGVRGSLWLQPDTDGGSETIVIEYDKVGLSTDPNIGVLQSMGPFTDDEIPAGIKTSNLKQKELDAGDFVSFAAEGKYTVTWTYSGTGTIKNTTKSASWSATGTIEIWHKGTTLSILAGTTTGTFTIQ